MADNSVRTFDITIGTVYNNGVECSSPNVEYAGSEDIVVNCIDPDCGLFRVQIPPGNVEPCLTFIVTCEECDVCPPQVIKRCFCDIIDDCPDCNICVNGICEPQCPEDQCVNGTCVECTADADCPCNQVCLNGKCVCPDGSSKDSTTGCCHFCDDDGDCDICNVCIEVNGARTCVPKECPGVCDPSTGNCVDCLNTGDCGGNNRCCVNKKCVCCNGFVLDPITGECIPGPDCDFDEDCPVCSQCVGGECQPVVCPSGEVCVDDTCVPVCDCDNPNCPRSEGCAPLDSTTCYCKPCEGSCTQNGDCDIGCYCNPDTGQCEANPCQGSCVNGGDCGGSSIPCGCLNGQCYPCKSLDCDNNDCTNALGCDCNSNNTCIGSPCGNACTNFSDCAHGCACIDNLCIPCNDLDCATEECADHPSCECSGNTCIGSDCDSNEILWCTEAVFGDDGNCVRVSLVVDSSGSLAGNYIDDIEEGVNYFTNKLKNRSNTQVGVITFGGGTNEQFGLTTTPSSVSLTASGTSTYTEGLDDAIGQLNGDTSNCEKWIVLLVGGDQTTVSNPAGSTFPNSGVSEGDGSIADENTVARNMADAARNAGYNVLVIAYGPWALGDGCGDLQWIADGDLNGDAENLIMVPYEESELSFTTFSDPARDAFDQAYNKIVNGLVTPSACALANAGDEGPFYCDDCPTCDPEDSDYGYECFDQGCVRVKGGTLTAKECCNACGYDGNWSCPTSGTECIPNENGNYATELECNQVCKCGTLDYTVGSPFYSDQTGIINMTAPAFYIITINNQDTGQVLSLTGADLLVPQNLDAGVVVVTVSNPLLNDSTCNETFNVIIECTGLNVPEIDVPDTNPEVCVGAFPTFSFVVNSGNPDFQWEVYQGTRLVDSGNLVGNGLVTVSDTQTITGPTTYTIQVVDDRGCTAFASVIANVGDLIVTIDSVSICEGTTSYVLNADASNTGSTYIWSLRRSIDGGNTFTNLPLSGPPTGPTASYSESSGAIGYIYEFTAIEDITGCTATAQVTISLSNNCNPCIIDMDDSINCLSEGFFTASGIYTGGGSPTSYSILITVDGVDYGPYLYSSATWARPNIPLPASTGSYQMGVVATDLVTGLTCASQPAELFVINSSITPTITGDNVACPGDTVTYTIAGGYIFGKAQLLINGTGTGPLVNLDGTGAGSIAYTFVLPGSATSVSVSALIMPPTLNGQAPSCAVNTSTNTITLSIDSGCETGECECFKASTESIVDIDDITFDNGTLLFGIQPEYTGPYTIAEDLGGSLYTVNTVNLQRFEDDLADFLLRINTGDCTPEVSTSVSATVTGAAVTVFIDCTDITIPDAVPTQLVATTSAGPTTTANFNDNANCDCV